MKKKLLSIVTAALTTAAFAQTARVQIIHNSADTAASVVDVYANGILLIDDFDFRSAIPYTSLPAGIDIELAVAPSTSSDSTGGGAADIIDSTKQTVNFDSGATYVAIASGLLSGEKLFQIYSSAGSESTANNKVSFKFFHGVTDAPAVDVVARDVSTLVANLTYGNFSTNYVEVPDSIYIIDVNLAGTSTKLVSYDVELTGEAGGSAVVIFASGFLNPTGQQKAFSVFAALADGTVMELSEHVETGLLSSNYDYNAKLIYPNPATSVVTVDNSNLQSLQFCDNAGALVKSFNGSIPSSIDISDLKPGMYVVKAQQNNTVKTIKLSVTQ